MFNHFNKKLLSGMFAILSLSTINTIVADDYCCYQEPSCNRLYIGGFGGQLFSDSTSFVQRGVAFFPEASGGALGVIARGHSNSSSPGFGGVQVGYELKNAKQFGNFSLSPAIELEALFYSHKHRSDVVNPTERLDAHEFINTLPTNVGVYLVNAVISLDSCSFGSFTPYVGGGIGAANIHVNRASSIQIDPPEEGINHFNSGRNDACWTFAAQAKAGVRFNFCERFHIFAEYRFLYIESSRFLFGATDYPGHAVTTAWNVDMGSISYNSYVIGLQFDL